MRAVPKGALFESIHVEIGARSRSVELVMQGRDPNGKETDVYFSWITGPHEPGVMPVKSFMPYEEAQALLDALLDAGLKPSVAIEKQESESFSAGKVAAMEAHLSDLRRLVFGKESVVIPRTPDTPLTNSDDFL